MTHRKENGLRGLDWKGIGIASGLGLLAILMMSALCAWLAGADIIALGWLEMISAVILLAAGFVSGRMGRSAGSGALGGWLAAGFLWIMLLVIQLFLFDPSAKGAAAVLLPIAGGCAWAHLLRRKGRPNYSRKKYGYR